jgi:hypothetical protein
MFVSSLDLRSGWGGSFLFVALCSGVGRWSRDALVVEGLVERAGDASLLIAAEPVRLTGWRNPVLLVGRPEAGRCWPTMVMM